MKTPKYGIIPAGGLGTRFLPASAAVPKELFPVFDTPLISFAIEEMKSVGVEKIFIICSPWKRPLFERYFNIKEALKERLLGQGKEAVYEKLTAMDQWPELVLVDQEKPQGLAQAVALCREALEDEAFYVLLPDEVLRSTTEKMGSSLQDLAHIYEKSQSSCVGLFKVSLAEVSSYGVAQLGDVYSAEAWTLQGLIEKPKAVEAPSQFMLPGRYLLTRDFWLALEKDLKKLESLGRFEEVHMTDALDVLAKEQKLIGVNLKQERYDVGRPEGLQALIQAYGQKA